MIEMLKAAIQVMWTISMIALGATLGAVYGWHHQGWLAAILLGIYGLGVGVALAKSPFAYLAYRGMSQLVSARCLGGIWNSQQAWACVFSGAFLGALFGYAMWRFDRLSPIEVETTGSLQTTIKANWLNMALPLVFLVVALAYLAFSPATNQQFLDSNGMKRCTEEGGKLSPREAGRGFRCIAPPRNKQRSPYEF